MSAAQILATCLNMLRRHIANGNAQYTLFTPADVASPSMERQRAMRLFREAAGLKQEPGSLRRWLDTKPTPETIARAIQRAQRLAEAADV